MSRSKLLRLTRPLRSHSKMTTNTQTLPFPDLSGIIERPKPVNVSSVPQRSPFRYPGGKTWFVPVFRHWIGSMSTKPVVLVEPFAGGGVISLTALFENLVQKAVMVELDDEVAAVWESVISGNAEWLANRILTFELSREAVINEIKRATHTHKEKAFQTILKNRTFHGGILAEGSGFLKYGENGKGIHSRWYPATIAKRILNLNNIVERIDFRCNNGMEVMQGFSDRRDAVFFIDPPYTAGGKKAGKRLYKHYNLEHERLFELCKKLKGDFLMTYDHADEVKEMARKHSFEMRLVPMNNTHHATMEELVIGRDLSWMDAFPSVREAQSKYTAKAIKKRRCVKSLKAVLA